MKVNKENEYSLTLARLRELFNYDPDTGIFTWRVAKVNFVKVGDVAGTFHRKGYRMLCIDYKRYLAHRLAWFYMTGEWPTAQIDHINGVKDDNRFCNLRIADTSQNMANCNIKPNNTTGFKGVSFHKLSNKYRAYIRVNFKQIHLGHFDTPEEAHAAYMAAAEKFFGEFARAA